MASRPSLRWAFTKSSWLPLQVLPAGVADAEEAPAHGGGGLFGPLLEPEQHLAFHHQVGGFQPAPPPPATTAKAHHGPGDEPAASATGRSTNAQVQSKTAWDRSEAGEAATGTPVRRESGRTALASAQPATSQRRMLTSQLPVNLVIHAAYGAGRRSGKVRTPGLAII